MSADHHLMQLAVKGCGVLFTLDISFVRGSEAP